MSLRILFADDSMTAQSMGKKILSEAGYEVVAVSNGAAAVKKIAEQKPDIIILDVYMPGYSGLEVCEKVRGSMDTTKTPVLLTVGKMEPYRAEDGNRVRADGVIVKPFEASDLLAIVKKLEERVSRAPARVAQPVLVENSHLNDTVVESAELPVEAAETAAFTSSTLQSTVEVPDHMAGNSAFGDLLNAEPLSTIPEMTASSAPAETAPPPPPMPRAVPEYEVPVAWRDEEVKAEAPVAAAPVSEPVPAPQVPEIQIQNIPVEAIAEPEVSAPEPPPVPEPVTASVAAPEAQAGPAEFEPVPPETVESPIAASQAHEPDAPESYASFGGARPLRIPVYQEPEAKPPSNTYEFMPTSNRAADDLPIPREPELQETAEETTRSTVADSVEPGLMTTRQQFEWDHDHQSKIEAAELAPVEEEPGIHFQDIPAEIAAHAPPPLAVVAPEPESALPPPPPAVEQETEKPSDVDFEARVAAAMAAYKTAGPATPLGDYREPEPEASVVEAVVSTPVEAPAPVDYHPPAKHEPPVVESAPAEPEAVAHVHQHRDEIEAAVEPEHRVPTFEYRPPISAFEPAPVEPVGNFEPAQAEIHVEPEAIAATHETETQFIDAHPEVDAASDAYDEMDAAPAPALENAVRAAAAASGADHQAVSQAVHRVMERLKPELVEEILRELKSKE